MATKLYVVCEYGWEYDDNYYYQGENNGAEPRKAYKSKDKAEADCRERNIAELKSQWGHKARGIRDHVSDGSWDNLVDDNNKEALFKLFNEHGVVVKNKDYIEIEDSDEPLPDEFFEKFDALTNLSFYCVTTVEADLK